MDEREAAAKPVFSWRHPATREHFAVVVAPVVFLVEFGLALTVFPGPGRWSAALVIAGMVTPLTVLLAAALWKPPRP